MSIFCFKKKHYQYYDLCDENKNEINISCSFTQ